MKSWGVDWEQNEDQETVKTERARRRQVEATARGRRCPWRSTDLASMPTWRPRGFLMGAALASASCGREHLLLGFVQVDSYDHTTNVQSEIRVGLSV